MNPPQPLEKTYHQFQNLARALKLVWNSAPGWTAVHLILVLVQGVLPLIVLYLTRQIVDTVSAGISAGPEPVYPALVVWIALTLVTAIAIGGCRSLGEYASQVQSQLVTDAVSDLLHAQSLVVDLVYYEDPKYYDALHRAQKEAPYRPAQVLYGLVQVIQNSVSLLGVVALLFSFNWVLGLVLFAVALPGAVVRFTYSRKLYAYEQKQTETERKAWYYHWMLVDSRFAKEVRLFDLGGLFRERFKDLRQALRNGRLEIASRRSRGDFLVQILAAAAVYSTVGLAAFQAIHGQISVGELVVIYMGFQSGLNYLQSTLYGLLSLYEDNLFLTNFFQFMDLKPAVCPPDHPRPVPASGQQGIQLRGVGFTYPGSERPALEGINLDLAPGEVVALVGENGSGKTTLVKLLCRLYLPTTGTIRYEGIDLADFHPQTWRKKISVLFQDYASYYLKAWENIWLGDLEREPTRADIMTTANLAGAGAMLAGFPEGYDTPLGAWFKGGHDLSTGEWQKVALARAFWRDANILILDEPTSSLDPMAEAELFRQFRSWIAGRSAILISHRMSTVQMADRIYVMEHGKIVECGSHADLLRKRGRYAQLYHAQAVNSGRLQLDPASVFIRQ